MPITFQDFENVGLRVGKIIRVEDFPNARKPAYRLWIDFGPELGVKKSSAQLTAKYSKESLFNRVVVCVTNFPPKQVADFVSEVLVLGVETPEGVVLLNVGESVALGSKIS